MYVVAITGASGSILGIRLIEELLRSNKEVSCIVSESAWKIIRHELKNFSNTDKLKDIIAGRNKTSSLANLYEYSNNDFFAPFASGTGRFDALVVIPCSMKSLAGIANGYADSLIGRIADVALKEGRHCILVPRETPLNLVHLENMLKVKKAGAAIVPPIPAFYTFPETIDDIIQYIIGKVFNLLGINHSFFTEWGK